MNIKLIKIKNRFRKDVGDLTELKRSIKEIGLLQPIVIDENNNLIAGFRRVTAFKELGIKDIKVNKIKILNAIKGEYDENVIRKNFTPSEAVAIWNAIDKEKGGRGKTLSDSDRVSTKKITGLHRDTLSKAKQVVESGNKELIDEMDRTENVSRVYRKVKAIERQKERKLNIKDNKLRYQIHIGNTLEKILNK